MKYLEIRPGFNVKKEDISCIEDIDMLSCKIITSSGAYESIYPSWRILMLLEQPDIEEKMSNIPSQSPVDRTNLFGMQHWRG